MPPPVISYGGSVAEPFEGRNLSPTSHRWPDPELGPWTARLRWRIVYGRPECTGLDIIGPLDRPDAEITADDAVTLLVLKGMRLAEWIASDRARMTPEPGVIISGMRRSTRERLQVVADVYKEALSKGERPTTAVAEHFGLTQGGASSLVARARQVGLLPPTSAGVPHG